MRNALSDRVQLQLAELGHIGTCSIEYPDRTLPVATITFDAGYGETVSQTIDMAGKNIAQLTVLISSELARKIGETP